MTFANTIHPPLKNTSITIITIAQHTRLPTIVTVIGVHNIVGQRRVSNLMMRLLIVVCALAAVVTADPENPTGKFNNVNIDTIHSVYVG